MAATSTERWRIVWQDVLIKKKEREFAGLTTALEMRHFSALRKLLNDDDSGGVAENVVEIFLLGGSESDDELTSERMY